MCTWGVSTVELVNKITECLDDIEGDFDKETLEEALNFMRGYCPTSNSTEKEEKFWRSLLSKLGEKHGS